MGNAIDLIGQRHMRQRIAKMLGLDPTKGDTWPLFVLDRLIRLEQQRGEDELLREMNRMMYPPRQP
jgi:hypothetical protein